MGASLGEGRLTHRRLKPFLHEFSYPVHMLCLDLDALPEAFPAKEGWGLNRRAFVSFRETDYLREVAGARLADRLRHLVFQRLAFAPSPGHASPSPAILASVSIPSACFGWARDAPGAGS